MKKAIVIFSGGPDSTAAVLWGIEQGYELELVTFIFNLEKQYGELYASMRIANELKLPHKLIDFKSSLHAFSDQIVILMHAGAPKMDEVTDKTKPHMIPFGAGIILSYACSYAIYNGIQEVIWGANKDDGYGNYDYTPEFARKISEAVTLSTGRSVCIHLPFSEKHKYELFGAFIGKEDLFSHTWSCKEGIYQQTGTSTACIARRISAQLAGVNDKTLYANQPFNNPLSEDKIKNPVKITDEEWAKIFSSEPAPKPW